MVCMASSTGRMIFSKRSLVAIRMPVGMPITSEMITEAMTMASVLMAASQ